MVNLTWTKTKDGELVSAGGRFTIRKHQDAGRYYSPCWFIYDGTKEVGTRQQLRNAKKVCELIHTAVAFGQPVSTTHAYTDGEVK